MKSAHLNCGRAESFAVLCQKVLPQFDKLKICLLCHHALYQNFLVKGTLCSFNQTQVALAEQCFSFYSDLFSTFHILTEQSSFGISSRWKRVPPVAM
jgi:hypothetical protein